eukprot:jgi/Antlo1/482/1468
MFLVLVLAGILSAFEIFDLRELYGTENGYSHLRFSGVIDAGSTGTRINIYGFNKEMMPEFYYLERIEPGISTLLDKQIPPYLHVLLGSAEKRLKHLGFDMRTVPIAFMATAGLRLVSKKRSASIMSIVRAMLKKHNIDTRNVSVITGAEEGMLALRSLMLLKKAERWAVSRLGCEFLSKHTNLDIDLDYCKEMAAHMKHSHTYGIIDMGGGSVQIAYVNKQENSLVSQSFLGFGLRESIRQIKSHPSYRKCRSEKSEESPLCIPIFRDIFDKVSKTRRTNGISNVNELFLISFFYDNFFTNKKTYRKKLDDVRKEFREKCATLEGKNCLEAGFLMLLLKYFNFNENTSFFLVNKVLGVNLNWSMAKAYDLCQEAYGAGKWHQT